MEDLDKELEQLKMEPMETQCAHIFAESTNVNLDNEAKVWDYHAIFVNLLSYSFLQLQYAANAWSVIKYFGYPEIQAELAGANIHSLRNILTLESSIHTLFDELALWLEPTVCRGSTTCY